jgi:hypothetical protein
MFSEIGIAAFPVTSIHGHSALPLMALRGPRMSWESVMIIFLRMSGECTVLCCRIFQFSLVPFPAVKVTHDDKVRNDEQDDGHADYSCH